MKYVSANVVFQEIPGEISLCFEISNCPFRCKGCHSPELQSDIGELLLPETLKQYIKKNSIGEKPLVTCVLFMGGDQSETDLLDLLFICERYNLRTALYTGSDSVSDDLMAHLDYLKTGKYIEELGPLDCPTTNQKLTKLR